jgi:pyridoxamine 5'-phosphate oxidase
MSLDITPDHDPIDVLRGWYREAEATMPSDEAHAIALATVDGRGRPAVRIVLARTIDEQGRLFFYTNYDSRKGQELDASPHAAAVFHWRPLQRQCRVEGSVARCSREQSDAYWASRPRESRLSAMVSPQSQTIESFDALEEARSNLRQKYEGSDIPRPEFWGGYVVTPRAIEFWAQGSSRLHERLRFEREGDDGPWAGRRLGP